MEPNTFPVNTLCYEGRVSFLSVMCLLEVLVLFCCLAGRVRQVGGGGGGVNIVPSVVSVSMLV